MSDQAMREAAAQAAAYYGDEDGITVDLDEVIAIAKRWWESSKEATYDPPATTDDIVRALNPDVDDATLNTVHELLLEFTTTVQVTVGGCRAEGAFDVVAERINHDEDFGFYYTINWRSM